MKTTISINPNKARIASIIFGGLLLSAILFALLSGLVRAVKTNNVMYHYQTK